MYKGKKYDVIVVGAGHAGCEAGLASARMGLKTLILTINLDSIAYMPCNPSIGGTAKGHLVREVDALGGEMGKNIDETYIQSKMLNTSKGPAVHSLRAQADKFAYQQRMKYAIERQENLEVKQDEVMSLILDGNKVIGVKTRTVPAIYGDAVVITTGTYLRSTIIVGDVQYLSGPNGMASSNFLSENLKEMGIELRRFKTGTPARIKASTIDYSKVIPQPGDERVIPFSFLNEECNMDQVQCYLTYTNAGTHKIITDNIDKSPMYNGTIEGVGPRYCPSIEDKVMRFPDKERHQVFLEPEGRNTEEVYIQGLSSSFPEDIQEMMIRSVEGLENCEIMRSGYAIEYDCIDPVQLNLSLEIKSYENLFFGGQINGTSGYEEAAAQGLIAGVNAALKVKGMEPLILDRGDAYIGVLIDDLVTKGTNEPYRMLTSRAEYRLILRQDNADLRLTEKGREIGLVDDYRWEKYTERKQMIETEIERLKSTTIGPNEERNKILEENNSSPLKTGISLYELLKRPEITYSMVRMLDDSDVSLPLSIQEEVQIQVKYKGYIDKQIEQVESHRKLEKKKIPEYIDFDDISGLRLEAKQKLKAVKPENIGQASRISGVSPADISVLLIHLEQVRRKRPNLDTKQGE
ncbi:tRNA uridine-5-carboxymethylaminomethyl(34) synthesis enzyme MnmG [Clostridium cylindrosporum]|uniref:tRNA uridine 5-carboxymethylaminomethyl modification enzyme MnmG n=1 Tax=Clostridium cylindrosporum DSM 605 TaxID=1121307 RepID=A0A0J8D6N6_CLOCY|nr:tRNA uridine-5-carboxymethylaminomethyl(34) synthesis enzyme MnmG [Clostridium cylindrosporum]KMT21750.1 tRNA uridine 5-carboxymethylaminomethyl modification enzyme MnmG [Clostridium cylindrosporum DSM 605]